MLDDEIKTPFTAGPITVVRIRDTLTFEHRWTIGPHELKIVAYRAQAWQWILQAVLDDARRWELHVHDQSDPDGDGWDGWASLAKALAIDVIGDVEEELKSEPAAGNAARCQHPRARQATGMPTGTMACPECGAVYRRRTP